MKKSLGILALGLLWCNVGFANLEAEYLRDDVWLVKTDDGCVFKGKLKGVGKKKV